ncbi:MAG: Elongation factor Ts [Candidatus Moranbacteria bacterium GW2011_GWE2_35_2-]|nr:MAG: Elongation factor Ts [Candidatus Moranbacteria bacterium GW2011_GWE2_35_2-]KKQ22795.1 MAG: Elongation factor Ts [Candidatus Moranbacteria bacterium GW2011_GWF2_37_11]KKQ28806.1 MAG: Elongation factor Ts [Candidatus Moranbacteria bacterium GW2011_GWD1_37_17]KKQ30974.1 MAG: Elongation factor Ts [Candidatus Moranbacteria bacterium GW2011_GWE1_37_24]KKQ47674.1 MAG: Elongation factor Ts [Candidatus Moranbacteria bacterium GW2011_GWD2_37_9]HBO16828.1 elongation factor Ts [Candidatus Moranbac
MSLELIKKIREKTGAGMVDIKNAIEEAKGDEEKTIELLRKKGQSKAAKKAGREVKEGIVVSYIHSNGKIGSMVKLYCETDFVARNEEFISLAKDIAMHISAMDPKFLSPEDVSSELVEKEKEIWMEQMKNEKKPKDILKKIIEGKEKKFREELALLSQSFVKEPEKNVEELINEKIGKIGENIQIGEFIRYEL